MFIFAIYGYMHIAGENKDETRTENFTEAKQNSYQ